MAECYTELEKAVIVLVENFYKYVSKHSLVKNKISKSGFRKMLQRELNHMLTVPRFCSLCLLCSSQASQQHPLHPCPPPVPCSVTPPCALPACLAKAAAVRAASGTLPRVLSGSPQVLLTPVLLQDTGNRKAADKLIQNLDANHDGRISFDEYWTMIGGITSPMANLIRQQECQQEQQGQGSS